MGPKFKNNVLFNPGGVEIGGANRTRITEMLAGSVGGCYLAVNASAAISASFIVTGMSASHKVWASVYSGNDSCSLTLTRVVPTANTITASVGNWTSTDIAAEGSMVIHYIAVKDQSAV